MKKLNRILWGVILVAIGVLLGLHQLELLPFDLFFEGWWTLFIIVPSVVGLLTEQDKGGSLIGLLFGVFFLLCEWDILAFNLLWKLILPVAVVLVGLRLLIGKRAKKQEGSIPASPNDTSCVAVFSGQDLHFDGQPFRGAEAVAVFGGVEIFAAGAIITEDCVVNATAVFGGVDLYLPSNVNVVVTSGGVFGGVENKRRVPPVEGAPTVYVRTSFVFGGVDIK